MKGCHQFGIHGIVHDDTINDLIPQKIGIQIINARIKSWVVMNIKVVKYMNV